MSQWFVETSDQQIEGPFSTEMIQKRLHAGQFQPTDRIWGRVLEDWRPLSWWTLSLNELNKQEKEISNPEVWHYAYDGATFGPINWNDLVVGLKTIASASMDNLFQVMVWTKGMKEWAPVQEFHEILDGVGVNKRETARAEIQGRAVIKSQGNTFIAPLKHIGEGGFGCDPVPGLISGEFVSVELQSDGLKNGVHAKAQVRYITDRMAGFKFTQLNVESKGLVVQYVRRTAGAQKFFLKAG